MKKQITRIVVLLLSLSMLFGLSACGQGAGSAASSAASTTTAAVSETSAPASESTSTGETGASMSEEPTATMATAAPVSTQSSAETAGDTAATAEHIAELLATGDFEGCTALFDTALLAQADADYLSTMWSSIATADLGAFQQMDTARTTQGSYMGMDTASAFCEYESGGIVVMLLFDGDGLAASLVCNYYSPLSTLTYDTTTTATPLFWEATAPDGTGKLYLFGSIHVADASLYELPEAVMNAYAESDALAVECDTVAATQDMGQYLEMTSANYYMDGSTITDHISQETYDKAVSLLTEKGVYTQELDAMTAAAWVSTLSAQIYTEAGLDSTLGVDTHLLSLAHAQGKEIREVESIGEQMELLNSSSDAFCDFEIANAVDNAAESVDIAKQLYQAYCAGDETTLVSLFKEEDAYDEADFEGYSEEEKAALMAESDAFTQRMYTDRDTAMTQVAKTYLDAGENVFFVVGAAHMIGTEGIVQQLIDAGYTVTPVTA